MSEPGTDDAPTGSEASTSDGSRTGRLGPWLLLASLILTGGLVYAATVLASVRVEMPRSAVRPADPAGAAPSIDEGADGSEPPAEVDGSAPSIPRAPGVVALEDRRFAIVSEDLRIFVVRWDPSRGMALDGLWTLERVDPRDLDLAASLPPHGYRMIPLARRVLAEREEATARLEAMAERSGGATVDFSAAEAACRALIERGAAPTARRFLDASTYGVRRAAALVLGEMGDPRALPVLLAVREAEPRARERLDRILEEMTGIEVPEGPLDEETRARLESWLADQPAR